MNSNTTEIIYTADVIINNKIEKKDNFNSDYIKKIIGYSKLNASEGTKKSYEYSLKDFAKFVCFSKKIIFNNEKLFWLDILSAELKNGKLIFVNQVIEYLEFLKKQKQSASTIAAKIAALKNFVNVSKEIQLIDWDISFLKGPKVKKSEEEGPSETDFEKILNYVNTLWDLPDYISKRNALLFYILVFCGLRESEVVSIKIENINFNKGALKSLKKGHDDQLIETRVPEVTLEKIKYFLSLDKRKLGCLFISKSEIRPSESLSRVSVWRIIKKICADCGLNQYHPHSFRHFIVTEALDVTGHNTRLAMKATGHKSERVFNNYEDKRKDEQGIILNRIEQKWLSNPTDIET